MRWCCAVVWWCGGAVVWWCGGAVLRCCGGETRWFGGVHVQEEMHYMESTTIGSGKIVIHV